MRSRPSAGRLAPVVLSIALAGLAPAVPTVAAEGDEPLCADIAAEVGLDFRGAYGTTDLPTPWAR